MDSLRRALARRLADKGNLSRRIYTHPFLLCSPHTRWPSRSAFAPDRKLKHYRAYEKKSERINLEYARCTFTICIYVDRFSSSVIHSKTQWPKSDRNRRCFSRFRNSRLKNRNGSRVRFIFHSRHFGTIEWYPRVFLSSPASSLQASRSSLMLFVRRTSTAFYKRELDR